MSRKTGRTPSAQERALWDKVVSNATPLPKARPKDPADAAVPPKAKSPPPINGEPHPRSTTRIPETFRVGQHAKTSGSGHDISLPLPDTLSTAVPRMDHKTHAKMKRGKLQPEGRLDLHGMTLAAAQPALTRFILSAQAEGKRLVLVITGKGRDRDQGGPIPERRGALRHEVPRWLQSGLLAQAVLDVAPAHRKHGGSGAYYVYLRRRR